MQLPARWAGIDPFEQSRAGVRVAERPELVGMVRMCSWIGAGRAPGLRSRSRVAPSIPMRSAIRSAFAPRRPVEPDEPSERPRLESVQRPVPVRRVNPKS